MNTANDFSQDTRMQLRAAVARMDHELEQLAPSASVEETQKTVVEVRSSWSTVVKLLALSPEPAVRECPRCKHTIRLEAKICGYCWTKVEPLPEKEKAA